MQSTKSLTHETKNNKLFKVALYSPEKATVDELKAALITLNIVTITQWLSKNMIIGRIIFLWSILETVQYV